MLTHYFCTLAQYPQAATFVLLALACAHTHSTRHSLPPSVVVLGPSLVLRTGSPLRLPPAPGLPDEQQREPELEDGADAEYDEHVPLEGVGRFEDGEGLAQALQHLRSRCISEWLQLVTAGFRVST